LSSIPEPKGNVEFLPFRHAIAASLRKIAALHPKPGQTISEAAISIHGITGAEAGSCREMFQLAFLLLADLGIASPVIGPKGRVTSLHEFHEPFGPTDVDRIVEWHGLDDDCVDDKFK
jgi:hypothetical protein